MASPYSTSGMPNTMSNMGPGAIMNYSSNGASPMYSSVQNGGAWQATQSVPRYTQQTSFQSSQQNVYPQQTGMSSYQQTGMSSSGMMGQSTGLMSSSGAVYTTSPGNQYTAAQGYQTVSGGYNLREGERVESTRKISSVVVGEEYLGALPNYDEVRYVEVPYIEEVVKHVPRREVVEVEKRVPKYEYEYVEKIVEIPQVQIVDKHVEVPQIQEIIRHVPKIQVVEVPREVLRHVPRIETKMIEKIVEVPGQLIEVPKPYNVENPVHITRYVDKECPLVIAQSMKPSIVEGQEQLDVDVFEYEPECVPVDVHVLKAVNAHIFASGTETMHKLVSVPAAQYNTMLKSLNAHLGEVEVQKLPYLTEAGRVPFVTDGTKCGIAPAQGAVIYDMNGQTRREFNVTVNGQVIANAFTYSPGSAAQILPAPANSYPNTQMTAMSQLQSTGMMMDQQQNAYSSNMMGGSTMMGGSQMMTSSGARMGASQLGSPAGVSLSAAPATARTTFSKEGSAHFAQTNNFIPMSSQSGLLSGQQTVRQSQFGASSYTGTGMLSNTTTTYEGTTPSSLLRASSMQNSYPMLQSQGSKLMGQSNMQSTNMLGQSAFQGTNMIGQPSYQGSTMGVSAYGNQQQYGQSSYTGAQSSYTGAQSSYTGAQSAYTGAQSSYAGGQNTSYVSPSFMMENNPMQTSISPLA